MIMQTSEIDLTKFKSYSNAQIAYFECTPNGVILHYSKGLEKFSLGAASFENAIKQWNGGFI